MNEEISVLRLEAFNESIIKKLFYNFLHRKIEKFNEINQTQYGIDSFGFIVRNTNYIVFHYDDLINQIIFKDITTSYYFPEDMKLLKYLEKEYDQWGQK